VYLGYLGEHAPAILAGQRLAVAFLRLVRERDAAALAPWLATAEARGLAEFVACARGIVRDRAAVEAALTTPWSNGQTAARVLQLQTVRRQMRGRGGFALVRRRVVTAACGYWLRRPKPPDATAVHRTARGRAHLTPRSGAPKPAGSGRLGSAWTSCTGSAGEPS